MRLPTNSMVSLSCSIRNACRSVAHISQQFVPKRRQEDTRAGVLSSCPPSTFELRAQFNEISLTAATGSCDGAGTDAYFWPANQPSTTVMRFSVSVPVLSEQIAVALPIVSQAESTRTKLLSRIIFCGSHAG